MSKLFKWFCLLLFLCVFVQSLARLSYQDSRPLSADELRRSVKIAEWQQTHPEELQAWDQVCRDHAIRELADGE